MADTESIIDISNGKHFSGEETASGHVGFCRLQLESLSDYRSYELISGEIPRRKLIRAEKVSPQKNLFLKLVCPKSVRTVLRLIAAL